MTSDQLEPSAHAPCTSTTLRATAGLAACADASAAKIIAASALIATTANFQSIFIGRVPLSSEPPCLLVCLFWRTLHFGNPRGAFGRLTSRQRMRRLAQEGPSLPWHKSKVVIVDSVVAVLVFSLTE